MRSAALTILFSLSLAAAETVKVDSSGTTCPGVLHAEGNNNQYCCIGGTLELSNCPGWPICEGPTSFDPATTTLSCATTIPVTAKDYTKLVESASSEYLDSNGSIRKNAASATSTGASSTTAAAATKSDSDSAADRATTAAASTATDDAAASSGTATDGTAASATADDEATSSSTNGAAMAAATLLAPACGGILAVAAMW